jgi:hypothetical protein
MIRLHRYLNVSLLDAPVKVEFETVLREYYALGTSPRHQRHNPAGDYWAKYGDRAKRLLVPSSDDKCDYCELGGSRHELEIDHFRPLMAAGDLEGHASPDHYGWLAFDTKNLYSACKPCIRAKRQIFPVEGPRGQPFETVASLRRNERALLLDPRADEPALHLRFVENGTVEPMTDRGDVTIKVLNLNRNDLQKRRSEVWQRIQFTWHQLLENGATAPGRSAAITSMARDQAPHAAVARAFLAQVSGRSAPPPPAPRRSIPSPPRPSRPLSELIESEATAEEFRLAARPLHSASFRNFRVLRDLRLQFPEPSSGKAPWLMLLGENAVGKSSILQGIGLALAGADEARRWARAEDLLTQKEDEGSIELRFWDNDQPVKLSFARGVPDFGGTRRPSAIMLGYGALRYPTPRTRRANGGGQARFTRLGPLMGPVARIPHPARWLADLGSDDFDIVASALRQVLPVGRDGTMFRRGRRIYFDFGGEARPLAELSAGYQAVVGMTVDIVRVLFERWNSLFDAAAIVLIDEIDAHLHPRWKMRIVKSFREAFPAVQFIASTHDPLVLRGLRNGEVALLRRYPLDPFEAGAEPSDNAESETPEEPRIEVEQDLPPIEGVPVDQLLTSRHFGLRSTLDPELEAQFNEYYHLQSLPETPERLARIADLKTALAGKRLLGRDQREQLLLEAADLYIARQSGALRRLEQENLKQSTLTRLQKIWDRSAGGETAGDQA